MTRPHRLVAVAAAAMLLIATQAGTVSARKGGDGCLEKPLPPARVGVQLFTYGSGGAIAADGIEAVIAHMAEVGMRNIERFGGTFGLTLEDYDALYDTYGVRPVASHGSLDLADAEAEIAEAKLLGQKYIGSGGFGEPGFGSLEDTLQTAANLNAFGELARKQGLTVYGHNHDAEFATMYPYDLDGDGVTEPTPVIEILLAETDPRYVDFEIDIHWARIGLAGGRGDPNLAANLADPSNQAELIAFLERWSDRISMLHIKDTAADGSITDVGVGTTDWDAVLEAADKVKYVFVEYDGTPDAYFTAENGFEYLTCLEV